MSNFEDKQNHSVTEIAVKMETVNSICNSKFKPTKKLEQLQANSTYTVTKLKTAKTGYGMKLVAELNNEFDIFLPKKAYEEVVEKNEETFKIFKKFADEGQLQIHWIGTKYYKFEFKFLNE